MHANIQQIVIKPVWYKKFLLVIYKQLKRKDKKNYGNDVRKKIH